MYNENALRFYCEKKFPLFIFMYYLLFHNGLHSKGIYILYSKISYYTILNNERNHRLLLYILYDYISRPEKIKLNQIHHPHNKVFIYIMMYNIYFVIIERGGIYKNRNEI